MRATFEKNSENVNRPSFHFVAGLCAGAICSATLFSMMFIAILFGSVLPSNAAIISSPLTKTNFITDDDVENEGKIVNKPRPIGDIRRDVKAYVKNSKQNKDLNLQVGAVVDLCMIHRELVFDSRYSTHQQMQNLRAQVASRLKGYRDELKVTMKRRQRQEDKDRKARVKKKADPADDFVLEHEADSDQSAEPIVELSEEDQFIRDTMSSSMYSMGQVTGGPTQVFGYLSGNFAPPWDYSDELIDLIESTINPDFWKTNGGDGEIRYYDPSQILVVSASAQVHDQLSDMLEMMRFLKW